MKEDNSKYTYRSMAYQLPVVSSLVSESLNNSFPV